MLSLDNDGFNIYTYDIYPAELSLNKANIDNKEFCFLILVFISIMVNLILKLTIKWIIFHSILSTIRFRWLRPFSPSYSVYLSQLFRFARIVTMFLKYPMCHHILIHWMWYEFWHQILVRQRSWFVRNYDKYYQNPRSQNSPSQNRKNQIKYKIH